MKLEIFDVEHGQCALLTGDSGEHMLVDCGHNTTTGWRPSSHLNGLGIGWIDELIISNFDEDHASDLPNIRHSQGVGILHRNPTIDQSNIYQVKSQSSLGNGISQLCDMMQGFTDPVTHWPHFSGVKVSSFWNSFSWDMTDSNNLSLVTILEWPTFKICFPGDMETKGWKRLLQREDVRLALNGVHVLIAPHHGRDRCEELFTWTGMVPQLVVISDGGIQYSTQETRNWYASKVAKTGVDINGRNRKVLTTRSDGQIDFSINPVGQTSVNIGPVNTFA